MEPFLTADQLKLYTLIWQRFVACQMSPAVYDTLTVGVAGGNGKGLLFRKGEKLKVVDESEITSALIELVNHYEDI